MAMTGRGGGGRAAGWKGRTVSTTWMLLGTVLVIHFVCWTGTRSLRRTTSDLRVRGGDALPTTGRPSHDGLWKRSGIDSAGVYDGAHTNDSAWGTLLLDSPMADIGEEAPSYIHYLNIYEGLSSKAKPVGFIALVLWMAFLFVFVGIVASDFFCPNLSTIASGLGLSESVAGVSKSSLPSPARGAS